MPAWTPAWQAWRLALPAQGLGGGSDGSLEGPASDVAHLLFHGAGEGDGFCGDADEVHLVQRAIFEARARDGRDDALLDFGARPADGELHHLRDVEAARVD